MDQTSKSVKKLNHFDYALAGGGSGFITRALTQPLDVLKIRLQLQVEPITGDTVSKYKSLHQAAGLILHEESIKAFWKGHIPAQFLSISYGMVQFSTFERLINEAELLNINKNYSFLIHFLSGSVAGSVATVVSFPFDVIRTRLVAQSEQKIIYNGLLHSCRNIFQNEGLLKFFRGLLPTIVQVAPHAGVQFMSYKLFNKLYSSLLVHDDVTLSNSLVSGSLAGLCSKTVIYPLDLVKKRMQIQGFEEGRTIFGKLFKCTGMVDAISNIYKDEGFGGFYKGLSPSLLKACITSAMYFGTYEMCCDIIEFLKYRFSYVINTHFVDYHNGELRSDLLF